MTNRMLINGTEGPATVSGVFTLRFESTEPMANAMIFIGGVLVAEDQDRNSIGPNGNRYGVKIRLDMDNRLWNEFDIPSNMFSDGVISLFASTWKSDQSLLTEFRSELTIANNSVPTTSTVELKVPHFSRDGILIDKYEPEKSFIPRAMFNTHLSEFTANPELVEQYKAAGFNAIFTSGVENTVRNNPACTQEQFEAAQYARIDTLKAFCITNDLKCIGDGMDWTYTLESINQILDKPWAEAAIKNTFRHIRNAGVFVSVDLIDELEFRWRSEADIPLARKLSKAIRNAQIEKYPRWLGYEMNVPISFTSSPVYDPLTDRKSNLWGQTKYLSDYLSLGQDTGDWRHSGDPSIDQMYRAMEYSVRGTRTDCPFIMNVSCSDNPKGATTDYMAMAGIGVALTLGATGIKVYALDTDAFQTGGQKGCSPDVYPERWAGMSHANNVIEELTPLILQPQVKCETAGRWFSTRAWEGNQGRLWLAVSLLNNEQKAVVPSGYCEGFVLTHLGKTAVNRREQYATVPPGGWLVMKD